MVRMSNYLKMFICKLSDHLKLLRDLCKKNAEFMWNGTVDKKFEETKWLVVKAQSLWSFDPEKLISLEVDASRTGADACIKQDSGPIFYHSRAFTNTQQRYSNIEQ